MSDRLSQLQRQFQRICELEFTSLGVIQRDAPPLLDGADWFQDRGDASSSSSVITSATPAELAANRQAWLDFLAQTRGMASEIVTAHGVAQELLDSLPSSAEHNAAAQMRLIAQLEEENRQCTSELNDAVVKSGAALSSCLLLLSPHTQR